MFLIIFAIMSMNSGLGNWKAAAKFVSLVRYPTQADVDGTGLVGGKAASTKGNTTAAIQRARNIFSAGGFPYARGILCM